MPTNTPRQDPARGRMSLIVSIVATVALLAIVLAVIVLAGGDDDIPPAAAGGQASARCTFSEDGAPAPARDVSLPAGEAPATGVVTVALSTNRGEISAALDRAKAPCTVESFASLVQQKYYDDTPCHRLTTAGIYVLQCGDPTGTGTGGPGYTIPDEVTGSERYVTGVLAMANTGAPHSGGGQFFIVWKDSVLPPNYTVFGTVTKGMSVLHSVAAKGSDNGNGPGDGSPNLPVQITSAKVVK